MKDLGRIDAADQPAQTHGFMRLRPKDTRYCAAPIPAALMIGHHFSTSAL